MSCDDNIPRLGCCGDSEPPPRTGYYCVLASAAQWGLSNSLGRNHPVRYLRADYVRTNAGCDPTKNYQAWRTVDRITGEETLGGHDYDETIGGMAQPVVMEETSTTRTKYEHDCGGGLIDRLVISLSDPFGFDELDTIVDGLLGQCNWLSTPNYTNQILAYALNDFGQIIGYKPPVCEVQTGMARFYQSYFSYTTAGVAPTLTLARLRYATSRASNCLQKIAADGTITYENIDCNPLCIVPPPSPRGPGTPESLANGPTTINWKIYAQFPNLELDCPP